MNTKCESLRLMMFLFCGLIGTMFSASLVRAVSGLDAPMTFSMYRPCDGNASFCGEYILAQGTITRDTPKKLVAVLKSQKFKPTIYFHSPGGDLAAGMEMGRIIRNLRFDTHVGGPYEHVITHGQPYKVMVQSGMCFSACAYAFLGGVSRELNGGGRLGVHQFSGHGKDAGESAAQITVVVLALYLDEMGIDRRLLDVASSTSASDIRMLPVQVARMLNVDNTDPPKTSWELKPDETGNLYLVSAQRQPRRDGMAILAFRRHGPNLVGIFVYRIQQNFRSTKELNDSFAGPTQFELVANNKNYRTATISAWSRLDNGSFRILFEVSPSVLLDLSRVSTFELEADWPRALSDINPSTEFGTVGLQNGIRALLR